ncbi:hypothetical protein [Novosphingobium beihaiensis]|uniref:Uncharacterized protein n=1 Tax=Novosphingobium beihaiensis TaxID=2930389 RepID=A0ABT0BRB1_9SPHN|nr:hypothetical protein [Novosphingobium beihaiensis]MCJ2187592.1 hypothetical protein [Novosphingobium beihaiensis]
MVKKVLLIAVLEEMERQEKKLETLFETRPEDWQEIYTSTRRQIRLCIIEMMNLAQDHLNMSEEDERNLREVAETFRWRVEKHQERWPVENINLDDELCVDSFRKVRRASTEFKAVVRALINHYRADEDKIP